MNTFGFVGLIVALAVTNASVLVPSANILQGPSSRTTLIGPEGSVISSVAPGGSVITESHPAVVAHAAPIAYTAPVAYSAPWTYGSPVAVTQSVATDAYSAPVAYSAPLASAHGSVGTVVSGPSGTISASRVLNVADIVGYKQW